METSKLSGLIRTLGSRFRINKEEKEKFANEFQLFIKNLKHLQTTVECLKTLSLKTRAGVLNQDVVNVELADELATIIIESGEIFARLKSRMENIGKEYQEIEQEQQNNDEAMTRKEINKTKNVSRPGPSSSRD